MAGNFKDRITHRHDSHSISDRHDPQALAMTERLCQRCDHRSEHSTPWRKGDERSIRECERGVAGNCKTKASHHLDSHPASHTYDPLALARAEKLADGAVAALNALRHGERAMKDQTDSERALWPEIARIESHTDTIAIRHPTGTILKHWR